jgi:hypothetical protein
VCLDSTQNSYTLRKHSKIYFIKHDIKSPGLASGAALVIVAMSNAATMMKCNFIVDCREETLIEAMGRQN